jgi:hypothetical protein
MQALAGLAATDFAAAGSPEGKAWMAALPSLLRDLARQWDLTTDGGLLGSFRAAPGCCLPRTLVYIILYTWRLGYEGDVDVGVPGQLRGHA